MTRSSTACHVAKVVSKRKGKEYVSYLLRQSYRQDGKVKHHTLANLSHLPEHAIETLRRALKGETLVPANEAFRIIATKPHGHVAAILAMIDKLRLPELIASRPCRERQLVLAMIVQRILCPSSKLAVTRHWHQTTLAAELAVEDATPTELYAAMDWLLKRQPAIEKKLAERHLQSGDQVLYDVSSSYYEGRSCPLAHFGHSRDGKKGKPIIVYGVLADRDGRPIALDVYPGNTADPTTVPDQVEKIRHRFGLEKVVLVGDRGMLTQTQIEALKKHPGLGWISALRSKQIAKLIDDGRLQRSLFDEENLAEISSPAHPGERLIACFNLALADERHRKRQSLLKATERELKRLSQYVARRTKTPLSSAEIGVRAGKVVNRFKVAKHFKLQISDGSFAYSRKEESIRREEQLDGIYVIRTSEPKQTLSAADTVRGYKQLTQLERGFRCLKGLDLMVRPIYHRVDPRVRAHLLLCLLAYYVEWHLRECWRPLLFADEELPESRQTRDPVAPAEDSASAKRKKGTRKTTEGLPVHSFRTLLTHLGQRSRALCSVSTAPDSPTFEQIAEPDAIQQRAMDLLTV